MGVHDHPVFGVGGKPAHVAHQMRRQFAGKSAAVLPAPEKFRRFAVRGDLDDAEVVRGVLLHVLEIFARAGYQKVFPRENIRLESHGDLAEAALRIEILFHFLLFQKVTDIAAVSLVPAEAVHVAARLADFFHEGRVLHVRQTP